jgi:general secretion pathway protein N
MTGQVDLLLMGVSSRLSTLDSLGTYRLSLQGGADPASPTLLNLSTVEGALQMNGMGQWSGGKLHFNGGANAAPGNEAALNNLLNIIGRRQGALSVISIG